MRLCFTLIALVWLSSGVAAVEDASLSVALVGLDDQQFTLTMPELDALPRVKISANEHGAPHVFEGALLGDVLAKVGAPAGKAIRGVELADVVIVEARDGYKVALDLAGTDAAMRTDRVILADRMDGSSLDADKGPFQLVVEGDLRPAWFRRSASSACGERRRRASSNVAPHCYSGLAIETAPTLGCGDEEGLAFEIDFMTAAIRAAQDSEHACPRWAGRVQVRRILTGLV